ncbi:MAG: hypothetical protein AAF399_18470 [Bacteroidota bacterium]
MKQHCLLLGWLLSVLVLPHALFGQTYPEPSNFCDDQAEDFCSVNPALPVPPYPTLFDTRYANDVGEDLPTSPAWPTTVGATVCADPFDVDLKLALDDFESTINGERSAWNGASDIAFFRDLDEISLVFFDDQGDQIGSHTFTW